MVELVSALRGMIHRMVEPSDIVEKTFEAASNRNWALVAAYLVLSVVWLLREVGGAYLPWLRTDRAGAVLSLVVASIGGVSQTLAAGEPLGLELILSVFGVAATASGTYSIGRKLWPSAPAD